METVARPIAWIVALQCWAVLLGHAGGLLGERWCQKLYTPEAVPRITEFYAHSGLWLLLLPIVWFTLFLSIQHKGVSPLRLALWVTVGVCLLVGIGITGVVALFNAMMTRW